MDLSWQIYNQLRDVNITLNKISAGITQLAEYLICNQKAACSTHAPGSIPYNPVTVDPDRSTVCDKPPQGWCSRTPGNAGPCAARVTLPHTEALDPYCHCQDPSCPLHDVRMTDIASDIDPEIMNHAPGKCIK